MSDFVGTLNPITGKVEWVVKTVAENDTLDTDSESGYAEELLASQYGDMLHDHERNVKYQRAIFAAVQQAAASRPDPSVPIQVLDIGTGTGLLAMMAATTPTKTASDNDGAGPARQPSCDVQVTACEVFQPMVAIARASIKRNNLADKVSVVPKRSTDMTVPEDMQRRAHVIVSEILDTELIGEGVLETMAHARKHLAVGNAVFIPSGATVYVQLVESDLLSKWHDTSETTAGHAKFEPGKCDCNSTLGIDTHAKNLEDHLVPLSDPVGVLDFDFANPAINGHNTTRIKATSTGVIHALIFWWITDLDPNTSLSTSPPWIDKSSDRSWRDHWTQAVHLLPQPTATQKGDSIEIMTCHDEYSISFNVSNIAQKRNSTHTVTSHTRCTTHSVWNHNRICQLNDKFREQCFIKAVSKIVSNVDSNQCVLSLGDGGYLGVMTASFLEKAKILEATVFCFESSLIGKKLLSKIVARNKLSRRLLIANEDIDDLSRNSLGNRSISAIVAEPYFHNALLPWQRLQFWYAIQQIKRWAKEDIVVSPMSVKLNCVLVEFQDYQSIRAPVQKVCGFDLSTYDQATKRDSYQSESSSPISIWEYEHSKLIDPVAVLNFNMTEPVSDKSAHISVPITVSGVANGIVCWMDYQLDLETVVSESPYTDSLRTYQRQSVLLLEDIPMTVGNTVSIEAQFGAESCDVDLKVIVD